MIMLDRDHLGVLDIRAARNAFGRQLHSFETDLEIDGIAGGPVHAVFIRAPWVAEHGPGVAVLARGRWSPGRGPSGQVLAIAFHPELSGETPHARAAARPRLRRVPRRSRRRAALLGGCVRSSRSKAVPVEPEGVVGSARGRRLARSVTSSPGPSGGGSPDRAGRDSQVATREQRDPGHA